MFDVSSATSTLTGWLQGLAIGDWVDIGCVAIALVGIVSGAFHGLSGELPIHTGWICGLVVGWYAYHPVHGFFRHLAWLQPHPARADIVSLVAIILLIWVASMLVRSAVERVAKAVAKQPADMLLGAVAGAFRVALLLLLVTAAMLLLPWRAGHEVVCHKSRTGSFLAPYATEIVISVKSLAPGIKLPPQQTDNDTLPAAKPHAP